MKFFRGEEVEIKTKPKKGFIYKFLLWKGGSLFNKYFMFFSLTIVVGLTALFVWRNLRNRPYISAILIRRDISKILNALSKIDRDCAILDIENDVNYIDFLSVEKFSGSEVGCLNLAYPAKWKGPYLLYNPTHQGKLYLLVKTEEGIFITPGNGVVLPNGLEIGKDIKIDKKSKIKEMMKGGGSLNFEGQPLAVRIDFVIGDWDLDVAQQAKKFSRWKALVDEFASAIPFTKNESGDLLRKS